ncbi:CLUMA_CG003948, isoform A [Clunio marinus]|uniref:CLUMA_CG003948, isoform A n=1 Tax=Clunio marinus TaxID=568069 RepID=A0A1J1HQI2_9DIPT|nr:CLUMA_CG003948, isoform A [Clunio marinus]
MNAMSCQSEAVAILKWLIRQTIPRIPFYLHLHTIYLFTPLLMIAFLLRVMKGTHRKFVNKANVGKGARWICLDNNSAINSKTKHKIPYGDFL